MLELQAITKDYRSGTECVHALRGVSLRFRDNEFVSILGPSGCGKTTLLNIIGGLDRIAHMRQFSDGLRYTGYLWDCMLDREPVSCHYLISQLQALTGPFYVFWDIHSCDRIFIPNYWKYPIDAVLRAAPDEIPDTLQTLPEDCYFFDDSLSWAMATTHEELKPGKRLCYLAAARNVLRS